MDYFLFTNSAGEKGICWVEATTFLQVLLYHFTILLPRKYFRYFDVSNDYRFRIRILIIHLLRIQNVRQIWSTLTTSVSVFAHLKCLNALQRVSQTFLYRSCSSFGWHHQSIELLNMFLPNFLVRSLSLLHIIVRIRPLRFRNILNFTCRWSTTQYYMWIRQRHWVIIVASSFRMARIVTDFWRNRHVSCSRRRW